MNAYEREMLVRYRRADLYRDARREHLVTAAHAQREHKVERVSAPALGGRVRALTAWLHRPAAPILPKASLDAGGSVSGHLLTRGARPR
jgi:hypothetical protein